jgi:hypothetical protein
MSSGLGQIKALNFICGLVLDFRWQNHNQGCTTPKLAQVMMNIVWRMKLRLPAM